MKLLLPVLLFCIPLTTFAQGIISEIMYDLEGTDTKREWIEIQNTGVGQIDLETWKFRENDTNHGLVFVSGERLIPPGGFAVIADNPTTFLSDWPAFNGSLFDSSFSLKNTGELLILRDDALVDVDSVSYIAEWGAQGDGQIGRASCRERV